MIKVSETLVMAFLGVIIVLAWFLVILLFVFTVKVLLSSWLPGALAYSHQTKSQHGGILSVVIWVTDIFPPMNIMRMRLA